MNLKKILAVSRWEFTEKVRTKSFLVSLILTPIIMVGFAVIPNILAMKESEETKYFGVYDETNSLTPKIAEILNKKYQTSDKKPLYTLVELTKFDNKDSALSKSKNFVFNEEYSGIYCIPADVLSSRKVEYYGSNVANFRETERFFSALHDVIVSGELRTYNIDTAQYNALSKSIDSKLIKLTRDGKSDETGFLQQFLSGYAAIILVMTLIISSAQLLVRSLLDEKSNRIMEILLSSCSSTELMFGKLLGLGSLGLFQGAIWMSMAAIGASYFSISPALFFQLPLVIVFAASGFFLYASLLIGIGSTVTTEQEAQNITGYIILLSVLPVMFIFPIMESPGGTLAAILSYIPFTAPTIMSCRIMLQTPEWSETAISLAVLWGSTAGITFLSAKIFRIGVLSYGKRMTLPEIFALLKQP